ncbi:restriction endonuclease [Cytobacillus firmus]|uniref:restriction endonuclease n=1 Tax=Cytobacillus firmus TaxID=1399 RepID=UPI00203FB546|nr:restriction endonuclease [Cytobacillus firmus]
MDGQYFEDFIAELFTLIGYSYLKTPASGDQGLDLILYKKTNEAGQEKIGVQCKRFKSSVSNKAVQEAFAGRHYYDCDRAIVVTPSVFTKSAKNLAEKLNIELMDGHNLNKILQSKQEYLLNNFYRHKKITEILINTSLDLARNSDIDKAIHLLEHFKEYSMYLDTKHLTLLYNNLGLSYSWKDNKIEAINIYQEGIREIENLSAEDYFLLVNNCLVAFRESKLTKEALNFLKSINYSILSPSNLSLILKRKQEILGSVMK